MNGPNDETSAKVPTTDQPWKIIPSKKFLTSFETRELPLPMASKAFTKSSIQERNIRLKSDLSRYNAHAESKTGSTHDYYDSSAVTPRKRTQRQAFFSQ